MSDGQAPRMTWKSVRDMTGSSDRSQDHGRGFLIVPSVWARLNAREERWPRRNRRHGSGKPANTLGSIPPLRGCAQQRGQRCRSDVKKAGPPIGDNLDLTPVDVLGQDNRRSTRPATFCTKNVRLAPGLDEGLLGRPPRCQVLGRVRPPLLRATPGLSELACSEGALREDGAGLIELGGETRNVHQIRTH